MRPCGMALKMERTTMRFILSFVVIISMLNIISGIVMLVKNKTRDVAILRTMGADRAAISRIFFIVGVTIGTTHSLSAGMVIAVLFCIIYIRQYSVVAIDWIFMSASSTGTSIISTICRPSLSPPKWRLLSSARSSPPVSRPCSWLCGHRNSNRWRR